MPMATRARSLPRRRWAAAWRRAGGAVLTLLLAAAGCTTDRAQPPGPAATGSLPPVGATTSTTAPMAPRLLAGDPLAAPTGLELLVSANPPRLLAVDAGTSRPVAGVPGGADRVAWVQPVGPHAVIVSEAPTAATRGEVFVLRQGATGATAVGHAADAIPTRNGDGLWLWHWRDERHCTLGEVGLDGRPRRPPLRLDCAARPVADTERGLLVQVEGPDSDAPTAALLDRRDGHRLATYPEVIAVAGDLVLSGGEADQGPFTLTDRRTGGRRLVPRPPGVGRAGGGLRSPDRRLLAVEFGDPAWYGGPGQVMDVWLLDLRTRRWRQLPGMPVLAWLKFTSMAWTGDGRLLLLGGFDRVGDALALWRPGQDRLAVRRLRLPADRAGSDSFVPR